MKIDDLIAYLQAVRAEHGNIETFHSDNEYGIHETQPILSKVIDMDYGKLDASRETVEMALLDVANPPNVHDLVEMYATTDANKWCTQEEFVKSELELYEFQKSMVAKYNAAPWSVVINQP